MPLPPATRLDYSGGNYAGAGAPDRWVGTEDALRLSGRALNLGSETYLVPPEVFSPGYEGLMPNVLTGVPAGPAIAQPIQDVPMYGGSIPAGLQAQIAEPDYWTQVMST